MMSPYAFYWLILYWICYCKLLKAEYNWCCLCKLPHKPTSTAAPPIHAFSAISDFLTSCIVIKTCFVLCGSLSAASPAFMRSRYLSQFIFIYIKPIHINSRPGCLLGIRVRCAFTTFGFSHMWVKSKDVTDILPQRNGYSWNNNHSV